MLPVRSDAFVVLEQVSNPDERLVTVNTIKVVIHFSRGSLDACRNAEKLGCSVIHHS